MTKPLIKPTTMTKMPDVAVTPDVNSAPAVEAKPALTIDAPPAAATTTNAPKPSLPNVESLSDADLEAALKLLRTEVRRREAAREASRPKVGSKVRILRGRPKFVGKEGTAVVVRKSRCFVAVPEITSPAYVLISDVELVER